MTRHLDIDRLLEDWMSDLPDRLPDRVIHVVVEELDRTAQWKHFRLPWRDQMNRMILALGGVAAVVVVAALALGIYVNNPGSGVGGQPAPSPSSRPTEAVSPAVEPTQPPSPTATARPLRGGNLQPGTYAAHPLPAPDDSVTLTFTVPAGWEAFEQETLWPGGGPGHEPPGGMGIVFIDITTINGDPCRWSGEEDDVSVGPGVDDLVEALSAQTAYEVSDPVDVTIGGYSGKRVDIVSPTEPFAGQTSTAPECDEDVFTLWETTSPQGPLWMQGPANRWQTNILDVDGTRLVIVVHDFPGTSPEDRAEMDAIIDSIVIQP